LRRGGLLALVTGLAACASPFSSELDPRPLDPVERGEYRGPPPAIRGDTGPHTEALERLARVFYGRIGSRRFNSISTFHDPALRELFATPEAFADYFAALADALTEAHFEALRPTAVELEQLEVIEPSVVLVKVRYHGENSLPLRWWSVDLSRTDRWERSGDRWWIIPGKL
jgi:hypothetical protein